MTGDHAVDNPSNSIACLLNSELTTLLSTILRLNLAPGAGLGESYSKTGLSKLP